MSDLLDEVSRSRLHGVWISYRTVRRLRSVLVFLGSVLLAFPLGWFWPRWSTIVIALVAWPVACALIQGTPNVLLLIPGMLCAMAAFTGAGLRRFALRTAGD